MSSTGDRIELPEASRVLLLDAIRQREQAQAIERAVILATRAALGVPDDYVIRSVDEGFVCVEKGADDGAQR